MIVGALPIHVPARSRQELHSCALFPLYWMFPTFFLFPLEIFRDYMMTSGFISASTRSLSLSYALLDSGKNPLVFPFGILPGTDAPMTINHFDFRAFSFFCASLFASRDLGSREHTPDFSHFASQMSVRHGVLLPVFLKRYAASELALLLLL
jgi:hypothetical protein